MTIPDADRDLLSQESSVEEGADTEMTAKADECAD